MENQRSVSADIMYSDHKCAVRLFLILGVLLCVSGGSALWAQCSSPPNAIVAENCLTGNPSTEWDTGINGADPTIVGFATDISVNVGQAINFKIHTNAKAYSMDIYRMGYYGGMGARKVTSIVPSAHLPQTQPACLTDSTTNLVDCGNWAVSASWQVPTTATSGVYFVHLVRSDTQGDNQIFFIVRNDASHSNLLFQTSDETWQAYNEWDPGSGGHSLYGPTGVFDITNRAFKVSYNRPFHTRDFESESLSFVFGAEYPMVRWLEANGYDVTYFTGVDADRFGSLILNHKVYLTVGHDEYVSGNQRAKIQAARDAGVNMAFFSGNETFWKTRWEGSVDGTNTPYRTLVCYKETYANAVIDPADPPTWTGTWRDPRFSPPGDGGRPENALNGTLFMVNGPGTDNTNLAIQVPQADGKMRFWRNTRIAGLASGQTATLPGGTLGYEWDEDIDNGFRPAGLFDLSTATYPITTDLLLDYGETYGAGTATHHLTMYRAPSGALVFGAGTVQWSWGLDSNHDDPLNVGNNPDPDMQQATLNLFADMGVQPGSLQPGLVPAAASTDKTPPTSTITSPTPGSAVQGGTQVTIAGTAVDSGGGVVAGVEVSYDGGSTWHPATGRGNWSYVWTPANSGTGTINSRAVDDSGNVETPGVGVSVTVQGQSCPCSIWSPSTTPGQVDGGDGSGIEVGVNFTSEQSGFITGIRFYKSAANTGIHLGNLWTSGGTLLGSAVFSNESASGWQQVSFSNPVAITVGTTYVASYYAPAGHYSADSAYFATGGANNPPLHALANTVTPNGVFNYGPVSAFPTSTFNATNYWVDVVFVPAASTGSGPSVASISPTNGATGISASTSVTATFNESMNSSTINANTVQLVVPSTGEGSTLVAATVSYNSSTVTATLVPAQPLAYSTTFTATVVGGANGVQDSTGNPLPANYTWSFTTAAAPPPPGSCPCSIWSPSATPGAPDSGDANGVEVGGKFRSDQNGFITGVRFYKSTLNTGTHVGNLWTTTGILLATVTFTSETASGWQQGNFSSPIPITANTDYIVSYHAPVGHYSADSAYFASAGVDTLPLHALANNVDGPNGVYTYGSTSALPTSSFNSTNYWVDVVFDPNAGPGPSPTVVAVSPANGTTDFSTSTALTAVFSESMNPTTIGTGTFLLSDPSNNLVPASVSYNPSTLTATLTPSQALGNSATYTAVITGGSGGVKDGGGDAMSANYSWSFTTIAGTLPPGSCPCTIWSPSTTPGQADGGDATAGEYGVKFFAEQSGFITGIRFYKGVANTGTHIGHLWSSAGNLLASATFTGETTSGWQQVNFSNAVFVTANTVYIASYYAPNGHYSANGGYFASVGVDNSPLHAPANGVDGPNGVYNYGATTFPTSTFNSANYWVDVVFTKTAPPGPGPTVTAVSPANASNDVVTATSVTATFSEAVDPTTIDTSTMELFAPGNALVTATVSYNPATMTATLNPVTQLAPLTSYTATVVGGTTDPRVKDLAGNPLATNFNWSFSTGTATGCPCTIWPLSTIPNQVDSGDATAGEFGVKFDSGQNGFITGIRFYKTLANTGTHIANLWTDTGTLLATATFNRETSTGWQQVNFANPVAITAGTNYVASYYAQNGHYSADAAYFATSGVDNSPLHALINGADGPNGVFSAGPSSTFPTSTFNSANYWVDVVFTTAAGGSVSPTVTSLSPSSGTTGVSIGTDVAVTFSEALDPTTINGGTFLLLDPTNTPVPATVSYDAGSATATLTLTGELAPLTTYTGELLGGTNGLAVKDLSENPLATNFTWTFTTGSAPSNSGPGGPILVITSAANPFTSYLSEILQTEGMNEFTVSDIATVTSATLSGYDLAVLGDMALTPGQVSMLTSWVNSGGNLIAMHPDPQLASLLGLTDTQTALSNAYLLVNTSSAPGAGIVNQSIQYHGAAELYTLNGATSVATLYSDAATATPSPAVTLSTVGNGQAAAFTYDLARSVVYTRQGNPAWSGQARDGLSPVRSDDLFFGAAAGDLEPDWVDLTKISIPQADEQQRLLANLILQMNSAKKPLPRFWYFPHGFPAAVIMTADDHGGGGTAGRFNTYIADSPSNCSVADWQCVRGTSNVFTNNPLTNAQAASYAAQGFEVTLHIDTNPDCSNYNRSSLSSAYSAELSAWKAAYTSLPSPSTTRTHCVVWSDYDTQPQVEVANGIRLDTTYYYYPSNWVQDRPGLFTGSGMPMRFTTVNGATINVYQAATQLTDESGQTYPFEINTLLNNAVGPLGYYGAFTANMHSDVAASPGSDAIVASAQALGVPIISARQMLQWLDGRNGSSFSSLSLSGSVLSFNISVGTNTSGIEAMLPTNSGVGALTGITLNGSPVTFTRQTIKGVQYAIFTAAAGSYQAAYSTHAAPLTITANNASRAYGTANPTFTASYSGFVNGDTVASLTGTLSCTTTATGASAVGTYPITCSGQASNNYIITYVPGTLTVTTAPLTITANNASRTYGAANPTFTPTYGGFMNGDTVASLTGTLSCATTATVASPVGTYPITCSGQTSNKYSITYSPGTLTVTAAPLTVTANNASRTYGAANPAFTATYSGFVNGDTVASLTGTLSCTTTATSASPVGTYPVTCSGQASTQYSITYSPGTLTVTGSPLTITANNASRRYGAANPTFTATYSGFVNGDTSASLTGTLSCTTTATSASPVGTYPVTCSGQTSNKYSITYAPGTLTVTTAPLTITANNVSRTYGAANPTFSATYSGFVNGNTPASLTGTLSCTTTATTASAVGAYPITCSGQTSNNYTITYIAGQLTVNKASLTATATNASRPYGSANPTFTGTIAGIQNGDNITATYSTTATPTSPVGTYPITPTLVDPNNKLGNYTVTIHNGTLTVTSAPVASLSPTTLSFSVQSVGTASPSQNVTVKNSGTATMTISSVTIGGDFTRTSTCGSTLAAGASCTIGVTFSPTATGTRSGTLTITDNAAGSPQTVSLSGTGTAVSLSPTSLSFSLQFVGTTSGARSVTMRNAGSPRLTISSISITGTNGGDFSQTNNCGSSLASGASCTISVRFSPKATGTRTAGLTIADSDSTSPQNVSLTGLGL